jgi:hypothetical protein
MNNSFYLTLNSSGDGQFKKYNTPSHFKVHLGQTIEFFGAWEVALIEIRLPMTIPNLQFPHNRIVRTTIDNSIETDALVERNYGNIADLLHELNKIFKHRLKFAADKNNIFHIESIKSEHHPLYFFSDDLKDILGLKRSDVVGEIDFLIGTYPINLNKTIPSTLSITSNIIKHQFVDNTHSNLLRIVNNNSINYKFGFDKMHTFERLQYKPLACNRLENMEFNIMDGNGKLVSFEHGTSTLLLHFRRSLE